MKEKKIKTKNGFRISLRSYVTVVYIVTIVIVLFLYAFITSKLQYKHYVEALQKNIHAECRTIAERLKQTGIHSNYGANVRAGLDDMALHYKGRVMIIDENYQIVCDTEYANENAYIIQEDVISVMTGSKSEVASP